MSSPRHASGAVMVGDFDDRMRTRAVIGLCTFFVVASGRVLLPQVVDTSTRTGWLIANSVWVLAAVVAVALVADIVRQATTRQVYLEVTASGIVLRTGKGPGSTMGWDALTGVILRHGHRTTLRTRRPWLRMILIRRGGAEA